LISFRIFKEYYLFIVKNFNAGLDSVLPQWLVPKDEMGNRSLEEMEYFLHTWQKDTTT